MNLINEKIDSYKIKKLELLFENSLKTNSIYSLRLIILKFKINISIIIIEK